MITLLAQAGGDPRAGIQSVFLGFVVVIGLIMLLNYKRLSVVLSLIAVLVIAATITFAPESMFRQIGDSGGRVLSWIASRF